MDPSSEKATISTLFVLFGFVNVVYPQMAISIGNMNEDDD